MVTRQTVVGAGGLDWAQRADNVANGFVGWKSWKDLDQLPVPSKKWNAHEYPGVYLFAEFGEKTPPAEVSYLDPSIFYVGESGRPLGARWYEYRNWFKSKWDMSSEQVSVAAFPTWIGDSDETAIEPLTTHFRLYIERRIIWERVSNDLRVANSR